LAHREVGALHAHSPATQAAFAGQATPQAPQFQGLDCSSTQAPAQLVVTGGHACTHAPDQQACPDAQAW
jgi:hypothetical protein